MIRFLRLFPQFRKLESANGRMLALLRRIEHVGSDGFMECPNCHRGGAHKRTCELAFIVGADVEMLSPPLRKFYQVKQIPVPPR